MCYSNAFDAHVFCSSSEKKHGWRSHFRTIQHNAPVSQPIDLTQQ